MDFFPTKGTEYLLVLGYLTLLVIYFRFLRTSPAGARATASVSLGQRLQDRFASWFELPEAFHYHRGHTWAFAEGNGVVRVGMDDFAQKLLGRPDAFRLPSPGESVVQGEPAWSVNVDGHSIDLLAPVKGQVLEVNDLAFQDPEAVSSDPYGKGWLFKVRVEREASALKNLLNARLARAWMEETIGQLSRWMGPELGVVLQDGGLPVSGFGRQLAGDEWPRMASELLLTNGERKTA